MAVTPMATAEDDEFYQALQQLLCSLNMQDRRPRIAESCGRCVLQEA